MLLQPKETNEQLDKLGELVVQSELFSEGLEEHMFGILPKESLEGLKDIAKKANLPDIIDLMQQNISIVGVQE